MSLNRVNLEMGRLATFTIFCLLSNFLLACSNAKKEGAINLEDSPMISIEKDSGYCNGSYLFHIKASSFFMGEEFKRTYIFIDSGDTVFFEGALAMNNGSTYICLDSSKSHSTRILIEYGDSLCASSAYGFVVDGLSNMVVGDSKVFRLKQGNK